MIGAQSRRWKAAFIAAAALLLGFAVLIGVIALKRPVTVDRPAPIGAPALPDMRIDLNRALMAELELLPGVGQNLARRIIEAREAAGGFRSLDELLDVPGIGPATLEGLRQYAVVAE